MKRGPRKTSPTQLTTTPERSELFRRVRQKGTAPEETVQEILMRNGWGYRPNVRSFPGSPDIIVDDVRVAIFVHGCFWHRHPGCVATTTPTRNAEFWLEKFEANRRRDRRKAAQLRQLGYRVLTIWECQTKSADKRLRLERRLVRFLRRAK